MTIEIIIGIVGSNAPSDKFKVFEKWLIENGTSYPKLELRVQFHFSDVNSIILLMSLRNL